MKDIAFFPLNLVVFPGENLNLHVFEPRYKQLIIDCIRSGDNFGIPSYVNNKIELGTEVRLIEVSKTYEDGRMDIKVKASKIFKVEEYANPWKKKLYSGGKIQYCEDEKEDKNMLLLQKFKELVSQLYTWIEADDVPAVVKINSVYDIAHKIGLKLEEEYELIGIRNENERLRYAICHIEKLLPALERAHLAQETIKQNGHFKYLNPIRF